MAFSRPRRFLADKIAELQRQQLNMCQETNARGWTTEQSALAFDTRFARVASLMRELAKVDEGEIER